MIYGTIFYNSTSNFLWEKYFINGPPIKKTIMREDINESPVLKVKYLNTFKKENSLIKDVKKL